MERPTRQTILFQPPNHIGLGHVSRLLAIALATRELAPDLRLPFVVSGYAHGLVEAHGLPHLSLPGYAVADPYWRWQDWDTSEQHAVTVEIAAAMVHALCPDLIVFDCFPNRAMLEAVVDRELPMVFCVRKLRDMSKIVPTLRHQWPLVRAILVPHEPSESIIPEDLLPRTHFIGPVTKPMLPAAEPRPKDPASARIVISGGGGGYPGTVDCYNLALEACARVRATGRALDVVLVTGPLFDRWWDLRLVNDVRILPFDPHLVSLLADADLVLCQGGYNTMAEIVALGVPTICLPAERGSDDQFERAQSLTSETTKTYIGSDPAALSDIITHLLQLGVVERQRRPATGARLAAELLIGALGTPPASSR